MPLKLNSAGGGSVTIDTPSTASNFTLTVPAANATVLTTASTSGMAVPAFSAYASTQQTVTLGTSTKVAIDTENFDTNSNFNTSLYRFTPTVAGYYQVNAAVRGVAGSNFTGMLVSFYRNGADILRTQINAPLTPGSTTTIPLNNIIYMNGTTDYLELYAQVNGTGTALFTATSSATSSQFSAALVRAA